MPETASTLVSVFSVLADMMSDLPASDDSFDRKEIRQQAMQHYLQAQCEAADERYSFQASTATIVKVEESGGHGHANYSLTIFARNPHGEYFMYTTTSPFQEKLLKHVSQRMARVVLDKAYIEPEA
ncbi:hypothetical protein ACO0LF_16915 [Undibacterium sp. Di27W]|uniref:hypothetical protein n=1 Tax=Undibacterium sp. Di27W TaxID=3413036 RepID=UPI003BF40813